MSILTPYATQNPEEAALVTAQVQAVMAADPAMAGITMERMLRLVPQARAIWTGQFQGQAAVIKCALSAQDRDTLAEEWQELLRCHAYMAQGRYRVAAPLACGCDGQVIVLAQAAGTPLLDHLWSLDPGARAGWFGDAAQWAAQFMAPTQAATAVNRGPWRNWAEAALAKQTHPALVQAETRVLQRMKKLSRQLRGHAMWRSAIGHGDFHPNNLIAGADGLVGIDLGGSHRAPIYKDMARFLTHMARRGMMPSGRHRFGVDAAAYDAFVAAFDLDAAETTLILPYFICYETIIRVEHPAMPAQRIEHGVVMAQRLAEDLKQVV